MIGKTLGHFRVLEQVGEGAMGIVYRAHDPTLGRDVALKVLPEDLARDEERLRRFRLEARALATVRHPSVAMIHGIEQSGSTHFLVLELISGPTLEERLRAGALPMAEALGIARQIAEALAAAHANGIIHRDLKPANVKLDAEGRVKVLDFGLAREVAPTSAPGERSLAATLAPDGTAEGALVGTPRYMSPEQLRGHAADSRSDLWALGAITFELLTGRAPFREDNAAELIAAILGREPDYSLLPIELPASAGAAIQGCLCKAADGRPATAEQVAHAFATAVKRLDMTEDARSRRPARSVQITFASGIESSPAWSPDGSEIVFTRETGRVRHLYRQTLRGAAARITSGDKDELQPAWSPDGRTVLFVRAREPGRRLEPGDVYGEYEDDRADVWKLELATGRETKLIDNAYNPAFSPDGSRVAVDASWAGPRRLWILDRNGRNPRQGSTDDSEAIAHVRPRWSPDGSMLVFQNMERTKLDVRHVRLSDGATTWVTNDLFQDFAPCWTPDGLWIVFSSAYRGGGINLWRAPVAIGGRVTGPPEPLTSGAGQDVEPAVSPDGVRIAFATLRQNADLWKLPVDPRTGRATGAPTRVVGGTREESRGAWSPDGGRIAFNSDRSGDMNLWLSSLDNGEERQLTSGSGGDYQPTWSPDGERLVFFSSREGTMDVWTYDLASGALTRLTQGRSVDVNPFYSPDGASIAFQSDRDGRMEVWVMRADGSEPRQLTRVGVGGHFLRWTPDGKHVIFRCPGANGVLRVPAAGGEPAPLPPVKGGSHLSLSPDASRIMDVVAHKTLWVSPLDGGSPEVVFEFPEAEARIDYPTWSPDGRWVLFDRFQPQGGDIWLLERI